MNIIVIIELIQLRVNIMIALHCDSTKSFLILSYQK
jgi:hypothetical protein